ncbi:glutathione S-transferase theta-3-like isoform X2 [Anneissia japonica]|uniref:glutathione S-transferase theta-3-like isoform X2 n=1 Tax=Anneissia japonica TaxID=1529436 RepID=UPI0014258551|nr:glutathione S-transferase theta-3-like isoform X2 [Anneissia japonica]
MKSAYPGKEIQLMKDEHKSAEYTFINPAQLVPAIKDGDFCLGESVAILRYLVAKYKTSDHWYPADIQARARVDAYLAWQHTGLRAPCLDVMMEEVYSEILLGKPCDPEELKRKIGELKTSFKKFEVIFLKDQKFVCSEEISVADIMALCEIIQLLDCPSCKDILKDFPMIAAWKERVELILNPYHQELVDQMHAVDLTVPYTASA